MEGERLLQCIKSSTDVEPLLRDLEVYLAPILRHKTSPSQELAAKYGLYSMKVLRACVQQLTVLKTGHATIIGIIRIANRSYQCIRKARKHTKMVPLSLEKLLFHMVVQSMAKGLVADATAFARNLHEHLSLCRHNFVTGDSIDNEYDTVCKQAFNQLWKACVDLEHSSKQAATKHMVVLDVRSQSLAFLMLTSYEVSWVVERALRAIAEFDRASNNSLDENNQVLEFLQSILDTLLNNLGDTKKNRELQPEEASELLSSLFELSLQFAKRCSHLKRPEEALTLHEKLQEIIVSKCSRHSQKLYIAAVSMIETTLCMRRLSSSDASKTAKRSKSQKPGDLVGTIKERIEGVVSSISKILEQGDPDFKAVHCLVEALEFFKKRFEGASSQQGRSGSPSPTAVSEELVPSVDAALKLLVDLLQVQREHLQTTCSTAKESSAGKGKQQRMSLQKAVNRQLAVLNLMSVLLLNRMDHTEAAARRMTEDALSVCQRTKAVIEEVSSGAGGALSNNEHRWLGTNAYNLGLMCYRKKWYLDAVPLLSVACEQLQVWCVTKELMDEEKVNKVQLPSKYELLVDCQRKAGRHREAMQTAVTYLWAHASHLTDQLTTPVEYWVKAKRDIVKSAEDEQLRTRTLFDAIQEMEGTISDESCSLVSRLLEQELSIYKAQRYDTTVEQYAVVCDLLSLYSDDKMRLHRAHAHIEQAQLLRDGTLDTDCSPVDCCKEALHLLEDLAQDFLQQQQQEQSSKDYLVVFDLLATAHFWLYICQSEANQATYITSQFPSTKEDPVQPESLEAPTAKKDKASSYVPSTSYTLAAEHAATEPLDRALDIWSDLMTADGCNQSMFNDPSSTGYCLKVAASLCELADRPIQQVQALNLLALLSTATSSNEDTILAYCQIIQALCRLGAFQEAESLLARAQTLMGKAVPDGDEGTGLEAAFTITKCYVMLAARKIGDFETLLGKALRIHGHKRRSRQSYLRNASLKHLQALYLLRPPTERSQDVSVRRDLIPDDLSPLELRAEAMRLQMGVGRLVLGEAVFGSEQSVQGDGFKLAAVGNDSGWNDIEFNQWTVLASVLQSLYDVGSLYMEQGCTREAKSYLKEGLVLADKFMLPRRSVAFLLQLSNLHTQCGQEEDCLASLSAVQQVLHLPEKASQLRRRDNTSVDAQDKKNKHGSDTHVETDEDDNDDNFIRTKRISISAECSSRGTFLGDTDTTSSPSLKTQTVKLPGYHTHPSDCFCASCCDVSLHVQEVSSFLRRAQCLELQGEVSQALTNLQVGLDAAAWSSKKSQVLLCKSCSCLQNVGSVKQTKGKEVKRPKSKQSSPDQFNMHPETATEIHACIARLTLLNSSLSEAERTIKRGLEQSTDESIPKAWLQFYEILVTLELKSQRTNTTISDLIFSMWDLQSSSKHHKDVQAPEEDLASQFDQLHLGKQVSKRLAQFQDSVFSERMHRPEVSRKRSDKVTEPGIFCDISDDDDDSNGVPNMAVCSAKSTKKQRQVTKATPHNLGLSSKKGALMFSVRKKRPAKKVVQDEVTPLNSAALSAFDFDEPSPSETKKKGTRGRPCRSAKTTAKRNAKIINLFDSDVDEVFEEEIETKNCKTATGSKRRTAKKSVRINLDSENLPNPLETEDLQEEPASSKPSRKSKQPTGVSEDSTAKPRRGRKPKPTDTEPSEPSTSRSRRGRKPNTENLRSEVVTRVSDDILQDLLSTSLELESPVKMHPPSLQSPNLSDLRFDFETNQFSRNIPTLNPLPNGTSLVLQDLDEIEIPRAGCDSDSDESKSAINIRRKTARKPAASRRKTGERCIVEDTEVLRGTKNTAVDAESTRKKTHQPAQSGKAQSGLINPDTNLASIISTLEQMNTQVRHRAPALLYRRVCQLLAACCGDRDPIKAAYYLSEATAVTLRHQKLASLAKKMKKLKKEIDADSVQNLAESLATMALDCNSKDGRTHKSNLKHLVNQRALFTFSQDPAGDTHLDVVQQTINALPEGWTVCILSAVSFSASLTGSLTDGDRLIMCRLSRGNTPIIVNQAMSPSGQGPSAASLLEEFDSILTESKLSVKETDKRAWWTCRQELDQRMQALTDAMEETLLGQWKGLLIGQRRNKEERRTIALAADKLKTRVESAGQKTVDSQLCQCILESFPKLSKPHLNSALACLTGLQPGSEEHSSLVSSFKQLTKDLAPATGREPVILILDKQIQQLPWETTPALRDTPICRMPSLYFILSHLRSRGSSNPASDPSPALDPSDTFYVLNPSNDLANTQKTFQKWFEKENGWKGVVARPPTKEEYRSALTDHQLFVFCGHGNGREFLTGDDIQRLTCRATSLLIGCSSGRLHATGNQEASGMVLNYLVAECPCLVANLWDVTDRDIDRFLEQLLRAWLDGGGSLLDGMAEARQACKLQHLIGCSPVVYGLPVRLWDNCR
ncbi:uncharacterized protein LOC119744640 [Patiria miniata]|uniref:separase n=1 Tax=Patiria miniata TaxID=46514 RepID=A0A914BLG2_PATMI|nr:uncharacterized protein LOC119744640 [Patiria miniata]XP_038076616.1 uncharacterized protein LOC119744640 [Patiria miniata]